MDEDLGGRGEVKRNVLILFLGVSDFRFVGLETSLNIL